MEPRYLRAVYGIEFCVALVAALQFWSEVGGQSHLDLMPWWWKAFLSCGVAWGFVKLTMAATRRQALTWAAIIACLLLACGTFTYYEHVNEPRDANEDEQDQVVPTVTPARFFVRERSRRR